MKLISKSVLLLIIISASCTCYAQQDIHQYNINKKSGLPSDHVYTIFKDSHGYLWFCTDKGVVKYNGYELKMFGLAEGLPNDDVWWVFEDKKGRIWLYTYADEMGYIYQDRYHSTVSGVKNVNFIPRNLTATTDGIAFNCNVYHQSLCTIYFEKNDTLYNISAPTKPSAYYFLNKKCELHILSRDTLFKITLNKNNQFVFKKLGNNLKKYIKADSSSYNYAFLDPWLISNYINDDTIHFLNIYSFKKYRYVLNQKEPFYTAGKYGDLYEIITREHLYAFKDHPGEISIYNKTRLLKEKSNDNNIINCLVKDSLWGEVFSTERNGIYFNKSIDHFHKSEYFKGKGYKHVGYNNDSSHYWWNKANSTLTKINKDGTISNNIYNRISEIEQIIPYNNKKSLMLANNNLFWIKNNGKLSNYLDDINHIRIQLNDSTSRHQKYDHSLSGHNIAGNHIECKIFTDKNIYVLSRMTGFTRMLIKDDSLLYSAIINDKFLGMCYSPKQKTFLVYKPREIFTYNIKTEKRFHFTKQMLAPLNIKKIEKILIDSVYDNIFIKDYDKLILFNYHTNTYKNIFSNYKLDNAYVYIYNNKLVVAGKFGILYSIIENRGEISKPLVYHNSKKLLYDDITANIQFAKGKTLINTNKGLFETIIPTDKLISNLTAGNNDNYRILATYNSNTNNLNNNDTIVLGSKNSIIRFDVINPDGFGEINYLSFIQGIDSNAYKLNSNELQLPNLEPGKYYTLSLTVHDDLWQSDKRIVMLYMRPLWWQTATGKRIMWSSIIALGLFTIYIIASVTRQIVIRQNKRKNIQLELKNTRIALELKSIYSQINPHFIFNTLNTGLYFIRKQKTKEAYTHISAFSDLLRAYIKSSRNMYISVGEEITNLENYILLQQARFENKFDYKIVINGDSEIYNYQIPSLLLQPLVENAINHGLLNKNEKGNLHVGFRIDKTHKILTCIIDDDGIGREKAKKLNSENMLKKESYGNDLTTELINVFNTYENIRISIQYEDKKPPEQGTRVVIIIKK